MGDDVKRGVMVCLYPPRELANRHALPYGEAPEGMHVTIAYLGHTEDIDHDALLRAIGGMASRDPFEARISGHARFTGGEEDVLVALVDAPELEKLRNEVIVAVAIEGITPPSEHGFTAHMTLAYMDPQALAPVTRIENEPVPFSSLWVVYGEEKTEFPFRDENAEAIRPYARTAYAQGWAASGGPMTDRVKAGCIAVMDMCAEHWDQPDILEVAIHLGQLEGAWASVFARRDKLLAEYTEKIRSIWQRLTKDLDVQGAVWLLQRELGVDEADAEWLRKAKAAARAIAVRLLEWLPGTTAWQDLRDAMRQLLAASQAEGYAGAIGVAASEQDMAGYEFDIAFEHAYEALINTGDVWAEGDGWLSRMLGDAAGEFGRIVGTMAADGAPYEDIVAAAGDLLGEDETAVSFIVDWAMSYGLSKGALDLYRSEGVQYVTWMTVGDNTVCPVCEQHGQDSPFPIDDFPDMPAHPRCRCVPSAEFTLTPDYGGYFGQEDG